MSNISPAYNFPAVRGIQSGRPCYVAMCPLRLVSKLFESSREDVPPELRAQRTLNRSRVPEIAKYLTNNPTDYTLSTLTASVNGKVNFEPMSESGVGQNVGTLTIPACSQILMNDGQHRRAAIENAVIDDPGLGHDNISVLFFVDEGLNRSQQIFADLNKHAVRPNSSISTLYDHREQASELARHLVKNTPIFNELTELEKTSISSRSKKLFTLSGIKNASKALLRKSSRDPVSLDEMELAASYWQTVSENMPDWLRVMEGELSGEEMREQREQYVHSHGVILQALGRVGADLLAYQPTTWTTALKKLQKIDWARSNKEWEGRAMVHGRISKARTNVLLTSNLIKGRIGLALTEVESEEERRFKNE